MATPLQHSTSAQLARVQASSARDDPTMAVRLRGCAPSLPVDGWNHVRTNSKSGTILGGRSVTPESFTFALKFPKRIVHGGEPRDRNLDADNIWRWEKVGSLGESFVAATGELGQKRGPSCFNARAIPSASSRNGKKSSTCCCHFGSASQAHSTYWKYETANG